MIEFWKRLLFVRKCLFCGALLTDSKEDVFCPKCRLEYEKMKRRACHTCGRSHDTCGCVPPRLRSLVDAAVHLFAYEDSYSQTMIFRLKRKDYRPLQIFLGKELAKGISDVSGYDITYAPRTPQSVRKYGFDQARALACVIGEEKGIPMLEMFSHANFTRLQKNLNLEERKKNAEKSYTLKKRFVREHDHLIIVDDVMTTGSTMEKLVSLAKAAGYQSVTLVCVAITVHERER
jgi:predicted amidophosphoribosyltransferase